MAAEGLDGGTAGDALRHLCLRSLPVASLGAKVDTHLHSILQNLIVSHQSILTAITKTRTDMGYTVFFRCQYVPVGVHTAPSSRYRWLLCNEPITFNSVATELVECC
jgi:hypothetical protein